MWFIIKREILLETSIKLKKLHHVLEFNQSQWLKPYIEFNTQKSIKAEKNNRKALYKLISSAIHGKNGKLRKQNPCKTSKQQKRLFKIHTKTKLYVA